MKGENDIDDAKELTDKQKRFCEEYVVDFNATRAYQVAYPDSGYNSASASSSRLILKKNISIYIKSISSNAFLFVKKQKKKVSSFGYVYIIECEGTPYYKIGKTKSNPITRLKSLQTSIPFDLKLIYFINVKKHSQIEEHLHWYYKLNRVRGEWFVFSDEQLKGVIEKMSSYE